MTTFWRIKVRHARARAEVEAVLADEGADEGDRADALRRLHYLNGSEPWVWQHHDRELIRLRRAIRRAA